MSRGIIIVLASLFIGTIGTYLLQLSPVNIASILAGRIWPWHSLAIAELLAWALQTSIVMAVVVIFTRPKNIIELLCAVAPVAALRLALIYVSTTYLVALTTAGRFIEASAPYLGVVAGSTGAAWVYAILTFRKKSARSD